MESIVFAKYDMDSGYVYAWMSSDVICCPLGTL